MLKNNKEHSSDIALISEKLVKVAMPSVPYFTLKLSNPLNLGLDVNFMPSQNICNIST